MRHRGGNAEQGPRDLFERSSCRLDSSTTAGRAPSAAFTRYGSRTAISLLKRGDRGGPADRKEPASKRRRQREQAAKGRSLDYREGGRSQARARRQREWSAPLARGSRDTRPRHSGEARIVAGPERG